MKRYTFFALLFFAIPILGFAQGKTSSAIEGTVMDAQGEPLPGANVVAIHQPTGTRYGTATQGNGHFTLRNVRTGGPYTIQVTFVGYNAQKKEIETIKLGDIIEINFNLMEGSMELDEISITASVNPVFSADRTGAKKNISREEIDNTPTLSRSLTDFTRLTPQSTGGSSFGGANYRYNNILVDGATLNDVFGLGSGTPGSQAGVKSPISIDAIQEFNVDLAPFDVTNNNFTGAQVNAITRSGTNQYSGSVYYQFRNQDLTGKYQTRDETKSNSLGDFKQQFVGFRLGGPIIKDKLFFFVNAELKRESAPLDAGIQGSGAGNIFPAPKSLFDDISNVFKNQYNYDPGSVNPLSLDTNNDKVLAKLDWNIDGNNKFTLRYNYVNGKDEQGISRSEDGYDFSNRQYDFNSTQHSFVAELSSDLSNNAFNEFRAVYTRIRDSRDVVDARFPQVELSYSLDGDFRTINAGIDRFSQANSLGQDLYELTDNFTYEQGNHEFTLGTSNQLYSFNNLFVQDKYGYYVFRGGDNGNAADYLAAGNPYSYNYSYLLPGGKPRAKFDGIQLGFYVQDKWEATERLTVTAGLRADIPILPDSPSYNATAKQDFGYNTSKVASGNILWSPRLAFNYDASHNGVTTQIRGGIGIFSGQPPFVWISNQYSNTGVDYGRVDIDDGQYDNPANNPLVDGFFSDDPNNQPLPINPNTGEAYSTTSEINVISKDFKYPQALKVDLAVDQELPMGIIGTLEGIYSKDINAVTFKNINLGQVGESEYGRPIYGSLSFSDRYQNTSGSQNRLYGDSFTNAILLDNVNKGYSYSITGELQKQFNAGLSFDLSYTFNHARSVNNGSSSRAISNWQYNENKDINNPRLGNADYERRHRILARASYRLDYGRDLATTVSLIYDGSAGTPYSWIYNGDANGDSRFDNDLVYVPKNEGDVILTSDNWRALDGFIEDHPSLDKYRGQVVPRGTAREPWTSFLDARINQEIMTFGGQKLEITASMFNVLNFISSKWGKQKFVNFNNYQIWNMQGYVSQDEIDTGDYAQEDLNKPKISFDPANGYDTNVYQTSNVSSRWRLQLGVRYSF